MFLGLCRCKTSSFTDTIHYFKEFVFIQTHYQTYCHMQSKAKAVQNYFYTAFTTTLMVDLPNNPSYFTSLIFPMPPFCKFLNVGFPEYEISPIPSLNKPILSDAKQSTFPVLVDFTMVVLASRL